MKSWHKCELPALRFGERRSFGADRSIEQFVPVEPIFLKKGECFNVTREPAVYVTAYAASTYQLARCL